jgi:hypothetical protein
VRLNCVAMAGNLLNVARVAADPQLVPTIRATCGQCGDVELTTADVRVRVCIEDNQGSYLFRCPACRMAVVKPAEPRIVDLLVASGVEFSTWTMPAELRERRPLGPAISHDDLLDFHVLLDGPDDGWFAELQDQVARGRSS